MMRAALLRDKMGLVRGGSGVETAIADLERRRLKRALFGRLGGGPSSSSTSSSSAEDGTSLHPILADPLTKDPLASPTDPGRVFVGRTDTYINLLEPASVGDYDGDDDDDGTTASAASISPILSSLLAFVPPPLRSIIANATNSGNDVE